MHPYLPIHPTIHPPLHSVQPTLSILPPLSTHFPLYILFSLSIYPLFLANPLCRPLSMLSALSIVLLLCISSLVTFLLSVSIHRFSLSIYLHPPTLLFIPSTPATIPNSTRPARPAFPPHPPKSVVSVARAKLSPSAQSSRRALVMPSAVDLLVLNSGTGIECGIEYMDRVVVTLNGVGSVLSERRCAIEGTP